MNWQNARTQAIIEASHPSTPLEMSFKFCPRNSYELTLSEVEG
jgi:hypothetical protein